MVENAHIPVVGFAAWSGTGKTTLLGRLIPLLRERGLRIGVVKHAHHDFEIDHPGKDSFRLRKAGANQMLIASRQRWALMVDRDVTGEPRLDEVLLDLDQSALDLILVEGFKHEAFPKIEVRRAHLRAPLLYESDPDIVAIATDGPLGAEAPVPVLDLNRIEDIAAFIVERISDRDAPSLKLVR